MPEAIQFILVHGLRGVKHRLLTPAAPASTRPRTAPKARPELRTGVRVETQVNRPVFDLLEPAQLARDRGKIDPPRAERQVRAGLAIVERPVSNQNLLYPNNVLSNSPSGCTPGPSGNCSFGSLVPLNGAGSLNLWNPRILQMSLVYSF